MKTPWPTKAVMSQIYEKNLWGGKHHDFYSGIGSHDPKIITPYLEVLISFFESHNNALIVCDLGCGDFNIGKHLIAYTSHYFAIDIVEHLIERNKIKFKSDKLKFYCRDGVKEELPVADCIIIRQVFQHLSNAEIKSVIPKLGQYRYVILTEHLPIGRFIPNKDIISGQGIRLKHNSGVDLMEPPFNMKVKYQKILNEVILDNQKGRILTTLFKPT